MEARFYEKFWSELLSAKFVYRGYCTLKDKWSNSVDADSWGIGSKTNKLQIVRENGKETIPYSPIMTLNKKLVDILADARKHAGYESSKDANYMRIKKTLPYPFHFPLPNE